MKRVTVSLFVCILLVAFAGSVFAASLGDPFDGTSLQNPNWQWQNEPDEWDVGTTEAGWLYFVPKINQNLWQSDTTTRLYQEMDGDFDVETHLVVDYAGECMVAGLVALSQVEDNWTTLKFWGRAGDAIIQWQHKENEVVGNVPGSSQPAGRIEAYLRMAKEGGNYLGWWKTAEGDDWIEVKPDAPIDLTPPIQIGIFGGICAGSGEAIIEYEYFKDLVEPVASVEPTEKLSATWGQLKLRY